MSSAIAGRTAGEIAASVRGLVDGGTLGPGDLLPPVRALAAELGVNRNTVVAAYRQLTLARITVSRGRNGTSIADTSPTAQEGATPGTTLRDVASGNPEPNLFPRPKVTAALVRASALYGEPTIDSEMGRWATEWIGQDHKRPFELTLTHGAVDAVERLLAQHLSYGGLVAVENPCFLASINTLHLAGYVPIPVPVDHAGMTPAGLRHALEEGARAVVCTPRAHNPTGASLSNARSRALRAVLADYPHVLVIEDDHFSLLSRDPYFTIIGRRHARWALVRSVSKFLGPDMRLAVVASDSTTAERLQARMSPGTTWVSHIHQRLVLSAMSPRGVVDQLSAAADHYQQANAKFCTLLNENGIEASPGDGLNVWVNVGRTAKEVTQGLAQRGWLARSGEVFAIGATDAEQFIRLTVHQLKAPEMEQLATDVSESVIVAS